VGVAAAILFVPAVLWAPAIGRIDADTLARSLQDELPSGSAYPELPACRPTGDAWSCEVGDRDSGVAGYHVRLESGRCWTGRRIGRSPGMPRAARGCAGLRHQLDLWF
jgi:hypothetical protein